MSVKPWPSFTSIWHFGRVRGVRVVFDFDSGFG
jgi:hypothetical protein